MIPFIRKTRTAALLALALSSSLWTNGKTPLLSLELKSYQAALDEFSAIGNAVEPGSGASAEAMLGSLIGPEALAQVDPSEIWHAAVWMDNFMVPPLVAASIPVQEYAAFRDALSSSPIGQQSYTVLEQGNRAILIDTSKRADSAQPGLSESEEAQIREYFATRPHSADETVSATVTIGENLRPMILGSLQMIQGTALAQMQQGNAEFAQAGIDPAAMVQMFNVYFEIWKIVVRDTMQIHSSSSLDGSQLRSSFSLKPKKDSELATWIAAQNTPAAPMLAKVDWDAPLAMAAGLSSIEGSAREHLEAFLAACMPLYGLPETNVAQWMGLIDQMLPTHYGYSMYLKDSGFEYDMAYSTIAQDGAAVYEEMAQLTESLLSGTNENSFYSSVERESGVRELKGEPVDQWTFAINPEHPNFSLPEQKAQMEKLFPGNQMSYEAVVFEDRTYFASPGRLEAVVERESTPPNFPVNEKTVAAGALDLISFMQFSVPPSEFTPDFSQLDAEGTRLWFTAETGETLSIHYGMPLKLLREFQKL